MKLKFSIITFLLLFTSLQWIGFTHDNTSEQALDRVTRHFHGGLEDFGKAIDIYIEVAENLDSSANALEDLQKAHRNTRYKFKSIEYLLEYFDPSGIKRWLNGAPLPTVEPNVPEVVEIEPVGLQVLDELVYSETVMEEKENILELLYTLRNHYPSIRRHQQSIQLTHRFIFEAVNQELVRIFTLGLTGFDTPGSVNALPEAQKSIMSLASAMKAYYPLIDQKDQTLRSKIEGLFEDAIFLLAMSADFDSFDRLSFLKNYINPLFAATHQVHRLLGVETAAEVVKHPKSVNYHAENIFDEDFLNAGFYANQDLKHPKFKQRAALGRLLFFDPILSSNNQRSCNSCHQPEKAFTDGLAKSRALDQQGNISRNSPSLINSVYSERYFYDLREPMLERQIKHVVLDSKEFDTDFKAIAEKLKQSKTYLSLFEEAYSEQPRYVLSKWSISDALASYVTSLTSFNSPFDQYVRGEQEEIDEAVKRGFNLFMGKAACGTCHFAPTFNGTVPPLYKESESEILGVPATKDSIGAMLDSDPGRYTSGRPIDQAPFYRHSFKTVTVRNVELTAPYMHNGVYDSLEEVVDFYNKGGGEGLGFEVPYQTLPFSKLDLTAQEQSDIVAFMKSLTDSFGQDHRPKQLPKFEEQPEWNQRQVGGQY